MADSSYYGRNPHFVSSPAAQQTSSTEIAATQHAPPINSSADVEGRLFVGGLSWQTTEESLRWHFEQYGQVASVEIMRDRMTGQPRGFGFVVFVQSASVDVVMDTPVHEINHKVVDVKRAQVRGVAPKSIHQDPSHSSSGGKALPTFTSKSFAATSSSINETDSAAPAVSADGNKEMNKVFVGGLPAEIDRDALKDIFSEFAPVTDTVVMVDQATGRSRGFGFVSFENGSLGAEKSVEAQPLMILNKRVEVKFATPRDTQFKKRVLPAVPKHLGLRAGQMASTSEEFAGLAVAYGRSGWKAGYGSAAFGAAGWKVKGWDKGGVFLERSGFSFSELRNEDRDLHEPPTKRVKH
ncbi:hypothetical protein MPSEU_000207100 [Mayamaea pseudoterrestris]|nr:hypothetical protein MPSEU_000207100 [Mayamaea pseudoterrestris]